MEMKRKKNKQMSRGEFLKRFLIGFSSFWVAAAGGSFFWKKDRGRCFNIRMHPGRYFKDLAG